MKARTTNKKGRSASVEPSRPSSQDLAAKAAEMRVHQAAEEEAAELALLQTMLERKAVAASQTHEPAGWNNTQFRPVPYQLRGMRPMHTIEPWSGPMLDSCRRFDLRATDNYDSSGLARLDDGLNDDIVMLRRRRMEEDMRASSVMMRPAWDSTPWHYVPPTLRGLKPVTKEPWQRGLSNPARCFSRSHLSAMLPPPTCLWSSAVRRSRHVSRIWRFDSLSHELSRSINSTRKHAACFDLSQQPSQ